MVKTSSRMRQVVDWSAAIWAGLIAGILFLALNLFVVTTFVGGNVWVVLRLLASIVLGQGVLAPPATYDFKVLLAALFAHFALAIAFSLLLVVDFP